MKMAFSTIGNIVDGMDLSQNNVEKIGDTLENIDWGNILIKSLGELQQYSENDDISGTNNSKLNNNAASVEGGSFENGSPAGNDNGSPAEMIVMVLLLEMIVKVVLLLKLKNLFSESHINLNTLSFRYIYIYFIYSFIKKWKLLKLL